MAYRILDSTLQVHQTQYSDGDVEDLDLEGVLGGIFSGYTSLTYY